MEVQQGLPPESFVGNRVADRLGPVHSLPRTHGPSIVWWSRGSRRGVPSFHPPRAVREQAHLRQVPFAGCRQCRRDASSPLCSIRQGPCPADNVQQQVLDQRRPGIVPPRERCCRGTRCSRRFASGPSLEAFLVGPWLWRCNGEPANGQPPGHQGAISVQRSREGLVSGGRVGPMVGGGA